MRACGYALIGFLLGAHPSGIVALLAQPTLRAISAGLRFTLYGAGLGWLILLTGSALALWLAVANRKRLGKLTGRRLLLLSGISLGGGILVVGMEAVTRTLLPDAAETARWASSAAVPFAAGAVALLLFAALAWLYAMILRNTDESPETALSPRQALYYPFRTLARAIRRRFSRKSRATHAQARGGHTLTCTRRFHRYLILLGAGADIHPGIAVQGLQHILLVSSPSACAAAALHTGGAARSHGSDALRIGHDREERALHL